VAFLGHCRTPFGVFPATMICKQGARHYRQPILFSPERLTLQPGLSTLQSAFTTDYATIMVGGVIASVPVLILFIVAQRFIIEGVSRSGLKG
jgi:ABC-type glycerol-3-phosphate transport system permease component